MNYAPRIKVIALAFCLFGLLVLSSALSFYTWQLDPTAIKENALLELVQGSFLLLASATQGWRAINAHEAGLKRDIRIALALFVFALFLREVDIDKLGSSAIWETLETLLRALALVMILGFLWHISRRIKLVVRSIVKILLAPKVGISVLACVFYACSWPFDRELFAIDKELSQWFEETFELNACLLFFCASLMSSVKNDVVKIKAPSF